MLDCFKLLHFHLGSQITNIRHVKAAITEAARAYADLVKRGAGLEYLDIGGGLGVDYDGSQTNFESSVNYTLQEYAADVVHHVQAAATRRGVPHPTIICESGRAVAAYHAVLVFGMLGVAGKGMAMRIRRRSRTTSSSRCTTWSIRYKRSPPERAQEAYTMRSRRWTWR